MGKVVELTKDCEAQPIEPQATGTVKAEVFNVRVVGEVYIGTGMGVITDEQFDIIKSKVQSFSSDDCKVEAQRQCDTIKCVISMDSVSESMSNLGSAIAEAIDGLKNSLLNKE